VSIRRCTAGDMRAPTNRPCRASPSPPGLDCPILVIPGAALRTTRRDSVSSLRPAHGGTSRSPRPYGKSPAGYFHDPGHGKSNQPHPHVFVRNVRKDPRSPFLRPSPFLRREAAVTSSPVVESRAPA